MDDNSAGSAPAPEQPAQANREAALHREKKRQRELRQAAAKELRQNAVVARDLQRVRPREPVRREILPIKPADEPQPFDDGLAAIIDSTVIPSARSKARIIKRALNGLFALLMIGVPTLAGIIYFGFFAANQYVSQTQFAIRSQEPLASSDPSAGSPLSGILGGPLAGLTDAQIVVNYLQSDQLIKDISGDVDLKAIYSVDKADWWARLTPNVTAEQLLDYWRWISTVEIDPLTGIVTLTVRGFTPQDAKAVSDAALSRSEKLVNRLSERSQADAVKSATDEVDAAHQRVINALNDIQAFQEKEKQINPVGFAQARSDIQAKLEGTLSEFEAQLGSLQKTMSQNAPTVIYLKNQIAAVKAQIDAEKVKATETTTGGAAGKDVTAVTKLLSQFDKLNLEREFAEKAYVASLATLESARVTASRQSRYLEAFVRPQLPQEPRYPNRPEMMLLVAACSVGIWLLALLIGATIWEHV
jgi:capsular polysaccharide transport system permease protein